MKLIVAHGVCVVLVMSVLSSVERWSDLTFVSVFLLTAFVGATTPALYARIAR